MSRLFIIAECPPPDKLSRMTDTFADFLHSLMQLQRKDSIAGSALVADGNPVPIMRSVMMPGFDPAHDLVTLCDSLLIDSGASLIAKLGAPMPLPLPAVFYVAQKEMGVREIDRTIAVISTDKGLEAARAAGIADTIDGRSFQGPEWHGVEGMINRLIASFDPKKPIWKPLLLASERREIYPPPR